MDWTATAFGLLVTIVGALATALALLVRRELDHLRQMHHALDARLRNAEDELFVLRPVANSIRRNMEEQANALAGRLR